MFNTVVQYTCLDTDFKCQRGSQLGKLLKPTCISNQLKCNGIDDCLDGEDEKDCKLKACGTKEVRLYIYFFINYNFNDISFYYSLNS